MAAAKKPRPSSSSSCTIPDPPQSFRISTHPPGRHATAPAAQKPCCVFPSEFPDRKQPDGKRVRVYDELMEYLIAKHDKMRVATLPFVATEFARKVVLYMLTEDFA